MAINPELITTIRVDQLPDETLSLTNLFPHTVGTDLKSATIQELVDLVATSIGVSGGVGYLAISVTDGQQLPDVPELPGFFLCGAGTYLNINGYPDVICTDELNAVMSLTDHWQLAVGIPIAAEIGVQSVTGSAVDNTDPLNPVINEIIFGVQNIIAGTNIDVDDTDPANPIISATGGGGTQDLQQVTDEGNETTNDVIVKDTENKLFLRPRSIQFQDIDQEGSTTLRFEDTDVADQEVFIRGLGGTMALTSDIPTNTSDLTNDGADGVNPFITALDIPTYTTPSIQEVLTDGGDTAEDSAIYFTNTANDFETTINQYGDGQILFSSVINDAGTSVGAGSIYLGNLSGSGAFITKDKITVNTIDYPFPSGASSPLATLADITGGGGGGIAHATASGTDTYTATITGVAAYSDADAYLIRFTNGNTTGATLNINALGAKTLYRNNDGALIGGDIINGGEMLCIYNTSLNGFQVIGTAPNSLFTYVTNADSVTITKGMPVYAFSGQGDRMTVKRANNSTDATSAQTVGLVLSTSIAAGQKGLIMMQGLLDGLSILPTATFADGDAVYLGSTAGTITNVKPYAPNHLVYLGVVTTASNGSAGRMYVRVQNGYELSEIHDIDLITNAPTNNQALVYESSSDLWKNKTIIEDSITNEVTTIAPSQNAVFDALALKQAVLAYSPYRNVQTSQTPHTGTTAETNIFTATIPAGAFNANDVIKVLFGANKTTALAGYTLRIRVSATNNPTAATLIANYAQAGTNAQTVTIMRNYNLNGGNLYGFSFSTSSLTDIVAQGGAISSTAVNPANQFFIFANIVLANAGDSIIGNMFSIHN